jgi:uncharacterized membrane protein
MAWYFMNAYPKTAWVTIMWYEPCENGNFRKKGWWKLYPGQFKTVFGDDLEDVNRYFYFHAQASDGAVWSGPFTRSVSSHVFDTCEGTSATGWFTVGYREKDIGDLDDLTTILVP